MKWQKMGLIFKPNANYPWMQTHAANPLVMHLLGDEYRIFFATRDAHNRSSVAYIDFNLSTFNIIKISDRPILSPGLLGYFDDHGTYAASIVQTHKSIYLYYTGWNPGPSPYFYTSIGLAISDDDGESFKKISKSPIISRNDVDPWMVSQPFVMHDQNKWRMWYISGLRWQLHSQGVDSYYHIKYAESDDGINWCREGIVAIELQENEKNIARPCIVKEDNKYKMWYSKNSGQGYRLGYAESLDGLTWTRMDDQVNLSPSSTGWDSDATAYPWVVNHQQKKYLFYNGNSFGKDGIGLAIECDE